MAKKTNKTDVQEQQSEAPDFIINMAQIKDGLLLYKYTVNKGRHYGEVHSVNGTGICKATLTESFEKLNVHLACLDDIFVHKSIEIENIDSMHDSVEAGMYNVDRFVVKGDEGAESVTLFGTKYTEHGTVSIETPRIPIDGAGKYKWYNELNEAVNNARKEVLLYMDGNYDLPEVEDEHKNQIKLFGDNVEVKVSVTENEMDADFKSAQVN